MTNTPKVDRTAIVEAVSLIVQPGAATELRALEATAGQQRYPATFSGYFDDPEKLAAAVGTIRSAKGIYFTPNPVYAALLARANNRLKRAAKGESTQDTHVLQRRWLLIDTDAQRPSSISATDVEHKAALDRSRDIYRYLRKLNWPDPIAADSGNGGHLLYRIDLQTDDRGLVQRCLITLAQRFDDNAVKIDTTVYNPARIWKLYGTPACKGDSTSDRPHRMARILSRPDELRVVETPLLKALAGEVTNEPPADHHHADNGDAFDLESFITRHNLDVNGPDAWNGRQGLGRRWTFRTSPLCDHHDSAAFLLEHASGAITARCHHDSCSWTWKDLRARFEPRSPGGSKRGKPVVGTDRIKSGEDAPVREEWPPPLDRAALHGLAGEIVKAIEPHTEADPVALLIQFLIAFGSVLNRSPHFTTEADRHCFNLFTVLVGETSKSRKGTSWGHVRNLFHAVDDVWADTRIMGGLSSGEGLIWQVRDAITKREPLREKKRVVGYQDVEVDPGVIDKRLLVFQPEFASVLKVMTRESNTLSANIRQAWDYGDLRTLVKNSPAKATGAHISIVGHITKDELLRHLTETEAGNGFGNRFLWLCVRRSKCLPEGGRLHEVDFAPLIRRLIAAVDFGRTTGEIRRDDEARAVWAAVYPGLSEGMPGLLGGMISRAEAQVMRLACLYALLDLSGIVRAEHLMAGLALWQYAEASARYVFGSTLGDPTADEILDALRRSPDGMTRTDINNLFGRHRQSAGIGRALRMLLEKRLARCETEETEGRPAERWFTT